MQTGFFEKIKRIPKRYTLTFIAIMGIIVLFVIFSGENNKGSIETFIVTRTDVRQVIEETGIVESSQDASLSFKTSGLISDIKVREGDKVVKGQVLAMIESREAQADILSAQAQVKSAEAELANLSRSSSGSGTSYAIAKKQQDALVDNARSTLQSTGLVAEPNNTSSIQTPPVVAGRYSGQDGQYKIIVKRGTQQNDYYINIFGVETVRDQEINKTSATSLGTKGLFVSFPDTLSTYADTIWYVDIPNIKSSSYLANYNAYNSALEAREVALENAVANEDNLQVGDASLLSAQASLARAQAVYSNTIIRAPFNGVISSVDATVGEAVSTGAPVLSLISENEYEINVPIPEADIANANIDDGAKVVFDAYDGVEFEAVVAFINPSAKRIEGVPVFDATLLFKEQDERIRPGLSADVEILAEERVDVLAIPSRAVVHNGDEKTYVRIMKEGKIEKVEVTTGLQGSDGFIEIIDGLNEGDEVVTFVTDVMLAELEK